MVGAINYIIKCARTLITGVLLIASMLVNAEDFTIRDIQVEGLNKVSEGLVVNNMSVRIGQTINENDFQGIIESLYENGFFSDIQLEKDSNGTLLVKVVERPSINSISFKGNKALKTDPLLDGLAAAGLVENKPFNPAILEELRQELIRQYALQGMQNSVVKAIVKETNSNSVDITFKIKESAIAKIKRISFNGNNSFNDSKLKNLMRLKDKVGLKFWSKKNQYLRQQLNSDLNAIESFYLDNGFLKFSVQSAQVNLDKRSKGVVIDISIAEGDVFTIDDLKFLSQEVSDTTEIEKNISALKGKKYSQKNITALEQVIKRLLGSQGFTFARVRGIPKFKENTNTVDVVFALEKGKRSYVRRINFTGNTKTQEHVLRREMRQLESAPANTELIEQSRVRLQRLAYLKDVQVKTVPVPGYDDQVDVNFSVEEQFSGSISANLGFSDDAGLQLGANLQQNNFLGSGQSVSVGVNRSSFTTSYNLGVNNPYYTKDGVSRGYNLFYNQTDFSEINVSSFNVDRLGGNINFGYPLSETQRLRLGVGYEKIEITTGSNVVQEIKSPDGVSGFVDIHGNEYDLFKLDASWRQSTLNRGRFPTKGSSQSFSLESTVPGGDLEYYKATYRGQKFFPISEGFTVRARTELGYGDSFGDTTELPFFENYFAGGLNSVRGFEPNTLGPRSTPASGTVSRPEPFGGNVAVELGADFIFPTPFVKDKRSIQTSLFVEAGNVFDTNCGPTQELCSSFDVNELRASVGIGAVWYTFVGPLSFSLSKPIKYDEANDETKSFQFSIGTSL